MQPDLHARFQAVTELEDADLGRELMMSRTTWLGADSGSGEFKEWLERESLEHSLLTVFYLCLATLNDIERHRDSQQRVHK
jgi:hypothetical protein